MKTSSIIWNPAVLGLSLAIGWLSLLQGQETESAAEAASKPPKVRTDFSEVPEGWLVGLDRAKEAARELNRHLLLDFAGSDWIPQSIVLEEKVLTKKEFIEEASEDFVLVRLDFPRKRHVQSQKLQRANLEAASLYEVQSYPTVLLADSQGRPYARTGWTEGVSVESFLKRLSEMRAAYAEKEAHLAKANEAESAAKVPHLANFLQGFSPGVILTFYEPEYRELIALDPEDAGGLNEVVYYEKSLAMRKQLDALASEDRWADAIEVLDEFGKEHAKTVQQKQQIEFFKLNGLLQLKRVDEVMPFLDCVIAMDPDSAVGKKAAEVKPELMKRIADALKRGALDEREQE